MENGRCRPGTIKIKKHFNVLVVWRNHSARIRLGWISIWSGNATHHGRPVLVSFYFSNGRVERASDSVSRWQKFISAPPAALQFHLLIANWPPPGGTLILPFWIWAAVWFMNVLDSYFFKKIYKPDVSHLSIRQRKWRPFWWQAARFPLFFGPNGARGDPFFVGIRSF